jgi:ethanolamine phosphate phosphodiesterase
MLVADTHMLGPRLGHWLDQLRREWQMQRSFQSAMTLFRPEYVFILGDIFDEGKWVNHREFEDYMQRFRRIFAVPVDTKLFTMAGNHDIGFHYATHPYLVNRFDEAFNSSSATLLTIRDNIHFVMINSVTMEGDGCNICENAEYELHAISKRLKCGRGIGKCDKVPQLEAGYSKPIVLQHYPMYRESDRSCREHDSPTIDLYRERWEVLSKESTDLIGELIEPRLAFSGHSHHFCHLTNRLRIEEYTVPSFNWRNKMNPSFLLVTLTASEHAVSKCNLPLERSIVLSYLVGIVLMILVMCCRGWAVRLLGRIKGMLRRRRCLQYKKLEH